MPQHHLSLPRPHRERVRRAIPTMLPQITSRALKLSGSLSVLPYSQQIPTLPPHIRPPEQALPILARPRHVADSALYPPPHLPDRTFSHPSPIPRIHQIPLPISGSALQLLLQKYHPSVQDLRTMA